MRQYRPELGDEIWRDFETKNRNTDRSWSADSPWSATYVLISLAGARVDLRRSTPTGWDDFYAKYPNSQGVLTLSRVGFNNAKDTAVLYAGNQSHWVAGEGNMVLMKKTAGRWTLQDEAMMWIS